MLLFLLLLHMIWSQIDILSMRLSPFGRITTVLGVVCRRCGSSLPPPSDCRSFTVGFYQHRRLLLLNQTESSTETTTAAFTLAKWTSARNDNRRRRRSLTFRLSPIIGLNNTPQPRLGNSGWLNSKQNRGKFYLKRYCFLLRLYFYLLNSFPKDFIPKKKLMKSGVSELNLFMIFLIRVMMKMKVNWMLELVGSLVVIWSRNDNRADAVA